jgi:hypothetical protein
MSSLDTELSLDHDTPTTYSGVPTRRHLYALAYREARLSAVSSATTARRADTSAGRCACAHAACAGAAAAGKRRCTQLSSAGAQFSFWRRRDSGGSWLSRWPAAVLEHLCRQGGLHVQGLACRQHCERPQTLRRLGIATCNLCGRTPPRCPRPPAASRTSSALARYREALSSRLGVRAAAVPGRPGRLRRG